MPFYKLCNFWFVLVYFDGEDFKYCGLFRFRLCCSILWGLIYFDKLLVEDIVVRRILRGASTIEYDDGGVGV